MSTFSEKRNGFCIKLQIMEYKKGKTHLQSNFKFKKAFSLETVMTSSYLLPFEAKLQFKNSKISAIRSLQIMRKITHGNSKISIVLFSFQY